MWTRSKEKLCKISAYYNHVNHFSSFKPTWSTNILAAQFIWIELRSPILPKTTAALEIVVQQGEKDLENDQKYKVISVTLSLDLLLQLDLSWKVYSGLAVQVDLLCPLQSPMKCRYKKVHYLFSSTRAEFNVSNRSFTTSVMLHSMGFSIATDVHLILCLRNSWSPCSNGFLW